MKHPTATLLAAAIAAALTASPAWSQGGPSSPAPSGGTGSAGSPGSPAQPGSRSGAAGATGMATGQPLSNADRKFVTEAAEAGLAEVAAGQLAVQKAQDPAVKQFAQRMVDEHTAANGELMKLAAARGLAPPSEPDRGHRKEMEAMQKRSGADFDRAYMKAQVAAHQKAFTLFERQSKNGQDPELKQWATTKLPLLREHLQMARSDAGDRAGSKRGGSTESASGGSMGGSGSGSSSN